MKPATSRAELHKLISDIEIIEITSLSLKTKINKLKRQIIAGQITEETAIDILYNDCKDHYDLYKSDLYRMSKE